MNKHDVYTIDEIQRRLIPIFQENNVRRAVLFGSYAAGNARPNSDVDILVDSGLRGLALVGLMGHVRDALQKEIDLIDVANVQPDSRVAHEINETGVLIYGG
ncbi:MAG: nucleotidyltransferase domain-containing protein [Oscillospiraceae bacterium]|nr:nucleotidyltransferase domain-containing protein [Oscillospiraceae bacterium]